jgi:MotA/TolQ/ExbB proton channel family
MAYPIVQALMRGHAPPADPRLGASAGLQSLVAAIMARLRSMQGDGVETPRAEAEAQARPATALAQMVTPRAFLSRCIVVQAIGAAGIIGLWIAGIANKPFEGDNAFLCWLIVGVAALGVLCVFLQRWRDVEWLATHVVRIGLLGTVVGLIIAFSAAKAGGSADLNEVKPMIAAVVDGMYVSLYSTLLGIATNLWLKINLRLLGRVHG